MANVFLSQEPRDIETAIMLEQAIVHNIGNAVAYTDGDRIFINTDNNLYNILPAYDHGMLKWLLWHERYHKELRHHNRFFRYLRELDERETMDKFQVTKEEVNIIMDILVHDSLAKLFPELIETAVNNLAQMRNRNSLKYTFKTNTLEEMLKEYADYKHKDKDDSKDSDSESEETEEKKDEDSKGKGKGKSKPKSKPEPKDDECEDKGDGGKTEEKEKGHEEGGASGHSKEEEAEDGEPEMKDEPVPEPEHDKTDWTKLEKLDSKEFIDESEADDYVREVNKLRTKKFRLGKLTQTLNGLVTTTTKRTYMKPSHIQLKDGIVLKGKEKGRTQLYLCFDASGSMGREMETFKEIISKSIPQAMQTPTVWFSGYGEEISRDPAGRNRDYYKGKFKDFMPVHADSGYNDDGDRTIELCWQAEQLGYSPIGVTDGGGQISWSKDMIRQLKRTVLVGQNPEWLKAVQKINPKIQILDI